MGIFGAKAFQVGEKVRTKSLRHECTWVLKEKQDSWWIRAQRAKKRAVGEKKPGATSNTNFCPTVKKSCQRVLTGK